MEKRRNKISTFLVTLRQMLNVKVYITEEIAPLIYRMEHGIKFIYNKESFSIFGIDITKILQAFEPVIVCSSTEHLQFQKDF